MEREQKILAKVFLPAVLIAAYYLVQSIADLLSDQLSSE